MDNKSTCFKAGHQGSSWIPSRGHCPFILITIEYLDLSSDKIPPSYSATKFGTTHLREVYQASTECTNQSYSYRIQGNGPQERHPPIHQLRTSVTANPTVYCRRLQYLDFIAVRLSAFVHFMTGWKTLYNYAWLYPSNFRVYQLSKLYISRSRNSVRN